VAVDDGTGTTPTSFVLTVDAVNDAPTITAIAPQATNEDSATGAVSFTIGDLETAVASLTVSGSSSNTALVPDANITFGGSGASRTVTIAPAANQSGTATVTVTVSDGGTSTPTSFVLTVNAVNDPPTISAIAAQSTNEDTPLSALTFTVGDADTAAASLTVSGSSSNTTLVPNANIAFGGSGTNRTVTVVPAANQFGTATITVTVNDGAASAPTSFLLTVTSVNDAPTITAITNQTTRQNAATAAIAFTVGDAETTAASLRVSATSSNLALAPVANITFGGSGATRTVTVMPPAGQSGTATITVTVTDDVLSTSSSFVLTVTLDNRADFNGDGKPDLLWQNRADGYMALWSLNGTSLVSSDLLTPHYVSDTNWKIVGTGDFNADGKPDIVWQEQTQGWVGIWLMDGINLLSSTTLSPASREKVADTNWKIAGVMDLNADGKADILWRERTQGWVAAWLLDGLTVTASVGLSPERVADTHWEIVGNGDLNGDGKADIIWQNVSDGYLAAWLMNGTSITDSVLLTPHYVTDTNWRIVATGDFNADGKIDLMWQDQSQGWLGAWLMNGLTLQTSIAMTPERVADTAWKIVGPK
jgi:hypothetical protein